MTNEEIKEIIEKHQHWLKEDCEGWEDMNADLRGANLCDANLCDAERSSATSRKCRVSKAKVISITNLDGTPTDVTVVASGYDHNFKYTVGEIVEEPKFDDNRWNECAPGIHCFITRNEAVNY